MAKRRSKSGSGARYLILLVVLILVGFAGFWAVRKYWQPSSEPSLPPTRPAPIPEVAKERRKVKIYVVTFVKDEPRLAPEVRSIPPGADPYRAAIEDLIAINREAGQSQTLIPIGTKLLGIKVKGGVAYADFSRQLKDNFSGGSEMEALTVNSILHTLTQFRGVRKVQILIEGKKVDTIGGHFDISEPVAPDSTLLGPGESE